MITTTNILLQIALLATVFSGYTIPETIPVIITGEAVCRDGLSTQIEYVNFKDYVKNVLPNEWGPYWNYESLKAGAIAVKMFAWSMVERRGFVWDCNWSQVYRPNLNFPLTDKAVDETWDILILDNEGDLYTTYYDNYSMVCDMRGEWGRCMGQWNSLEDAQRGMDFIEILEKYYLNSEIVVLKEKPEIDMDFLYRYHLFALMEEPLYIRFLKEEHSYE